MMMIRKPLLFLFFACCPWCLLQAGAHTPVYDTTEVVRSEFIYDEAGFPACHAATIVETSRGELMVALFGGTYEGHPDCSIWTSHLRPKGWEKPHLAADGIVDSVKTACWNPVLFQVPGGDLLLFYKVGRNVQAWTGWLVRSSDGGYTWSEPERLPDGILGPIKNKPLLLGDRLLCGTSLERGGWRTYLEITDPEVSSWRSVGPLNNRKSPIQMIQPTFLRHRGDSLQVICRAVDLRGNIISVFSGDGGETWGTPVSSGLPNNDSGLDAVTLHDGRHLLVYNHIEATKSGAASRNPINVALSVDGRTWYAALQLENAPGEEFSYPSVIQSRDGLVHIVYTWHRKRIKHVVIDPSKLRIDPCRRIVDEVWVADPEAERTRREAVADSLLGRMTLEEKLDCLSGHWRPHDRGTHDLYAWGVPRLGIPDLRMEYVAQGVHTNGKSTLYPSPLALAATFDPGLIERVARNIAADCRARGIQVALAPEVTLFDPGMAELRAGTFGDDPEHVGSCAVAFARGLARGRVMPIGRYCAVDAQGAESRSAAQREVLRRLCDSDCLAGLILRGESDGVLATENDRFNIDFLRRACRFEGLLVSDIWQTRSTLPAFRAGLSLDLPKGEWLQAGKLRPLVESGEIERPEVDARVRGILSARLQFGDMEPCGPDFGIPENRPQSRMMSLEAARRGLVLLKNDHRILPLSEGKGSVLVLGNRVYRNSESHDLTSVYPYRRVTLADALSGLEGFDLLPAPDEYIDLTLAGEFFDPADPARPGVRATYFGNDSLSGSPVSDSLEPFIDYAWGEETPAPGCPTSGFSARWRTLYRPEADAVVRFGVSGQGGFRLLVDGVEVCRNGLDTPAAEACYLFRAVTGREYRVELEYVASMPSPDIQFTCARIPAGDLDARMRRASKIVVSVGSDGDLDPESRFWVDLAAVYCKKTVIVMQSCDLRDLSWCDSAAGVVQAWHAGESAGQAIADLLLGRIDASGRMPVTTERYPFGYGLRY